MRSGAMPPAAGIERSWPVLPCEAWSHPWHAADSGDTLSSQVMDGGAAMALSTSCSAEPRVRFADPVDVAGESVAMVPDASKTVS
jgi:hypothetical protein